MGLGRRGGDAAAVSMAVMSAGASASPCARLLALDLDCVMFLSDNDEQEVSSSECSPRIAGTDGPRAGQDILDENI